MKNKDFITLNEMFRRLNKMDKVYTLFDKLTFLNIFIIWALIVITFGAVYYFLAGPNSFLLYNPNNTPVNSSLDSIYFSFITATTTGFGDIIPYGIFKVVAILEVVFGLLLLAFVTSKLVSIKQDAILSEIYEISFNEKISRLRSSLLLFRQNLNRIIDRIEEGSVRKREISDIYIHLASLDNVLNEALTFFGKVGGSFTKVLDSLSTELIANSVMKSFEKLDELIITLNQVKMEWKRDVTIELVNRCIGLNENLFEKIKSMGALPEKSISDLTAQKSKIIESIKSGLNVPAVQILGENGAGWARTINLPDIGRLH